MATPYCRRPADTQPAGSVLSDKWVSDLPRSRVPREPDRPHNQRHCSAGQTTIRKRHVPPRRVLQLRQALKWLER